MGNVNRGEFKAAAGSDFLVFPAMRKNLLAPGSQVMEALDVLPSETLQPLPEQPLKMVLALTHSHSRFPLR